MLIYTVIVNSNKNENNALKSFDDSEEALCFMEGEAELDCRENGFEYSLADRSSFIDLVNNTTNETKSMKISMNYLEQMEK
jgi:hypothetical protein